GRTSTPEGASRSAPARRDSARLPSGLFPVYFEHRQGISGHIRAALPPRHSQASSFRTIWNQRNAESEFFSDDLGFPRHTTAFFSDDPGSKSGSSCLLFGRSGVFAG